MSGPFRREHRELSDAEKALLENMKTKAEELYTFLIVPRNSDNSQYIRAMAVARTKLEESVMWATKAITG